MKFFILFLSCYYIILADGWRTNEMEISVFLKNKNEGTYLQELKLMGDFYPQGMARVYVTPEELKKIAEKGIQYTIIVENLNEHYKDFWIRGKYLTYEQILEEMNTLTTSYPTICKKYSFGKSVQNRELCALKISDNVETDEAEAEMVFDGGIHGDEVGGGENLIKFAKELCAGYTTDRTIQDLINNREIWFYCLVNPDGRVSMKRTNANGVDLNRNWGYMEKKGFTQPETRAFRNCLLAHQFAIQVTYHSGMVGILYPWCYQKEGITDKTIHHNLSQVYKGSSQYTGGFTIIQSNHDYSTTGETIDFSYGSCGTVSLTMEISSSKQPSDITGFYQKNKEAMKTMIEYAGYGCRGLVTDEKSGKPVAAILFFNDYFPCYSDPIVGDYQRYLDKGTYSLQVIAYGYEPKKIDQITIKSKEATTVDIPLKPKSEHKTCGVHKVAFVDKGKGYTHAVLGEPDSKNFNLSGTIDLVMQNPVKKNSGNEISVHIGSGNYTVYGSIAIDGPWKSFGTASATSQFDIAKTGLEVVQYIRVKGSCALDAVTAQVENTTMVSPLSIAQASISPFVQINHRTIVIKSIPASWKFLAIYSPIGRCVYQSSDIEHQNIYFTAKKSGVYILHLTSGSKSWEKRVTLIR